MFVATLYFHGEWRIKGAHMSYMSRYETPSITHTHILLLNSCIYPA